MNDSFDALVDELVVDVRRRDGSISLYRFAPDVSLSALDVTALLSEYAVAYITLAFSVATLSVCYDRLLARIANDPLYTLGAGPFIDE